MTGKLIPFPRRETPKPLCAEIVTDGTITVTASCTGVMHFFTDRGQPCECGDERWPEETPA